MRFFVALKLLLGTWTAHSFSTSLGKDTWTVAFLTASPLNAKL